EIDGRAEGALGERGFEAPIVERLLEEGADLEPDEEALGLVRERVAREVLGDEGEDLAELGVPRRERRADPDGGVDDGLEIGEVGAGAAELVGVVVERAHEGLDVLGREQRLDVEARDLDDVDRGRERALEGPEREEVRADRVAREERGEGEGEDEPPHRARLRWRSQVRRMSPRKKRAERISIASRPPFARVEPTWAR